MTVFDVVKTVHVPVALACLPVFWVAALSKKGGKVHVLFGRLFTAGMGFTAVTGMWMAGTLGLRAYYADTLDGASAAIAGRIFLIYVGTLTLVPVVNGWRIAHTRRTPEVLGSLPYRAFVAVPLLGALLSIAAAIVLRPPSAALLLAMSPLGFLLTILGLRYVKDPKTPPRRWFYAHLTMMLAGGIAAHTAGATFLVRELNMVLPGAVAMVPWLLPSVVGIPAIVVFNRKYRRKFGDA